MTISENIPAPEPQNLVTDSHNQVSEALMDLGRCTCIRHKGLRGVLGTRIACTCIAASQQGVSLPQTNGIIPSNMTVLSVDRLSSKRKEPQLPKQIGLTGAFDCL
eukprot:scpid23342/ scgid14150/ 